MRKFFPLFFAMASAVCVFINKIVFFLACDAKKHLREKKNGE